MKEMTEQDGESLDIVNENLEALKAIFPSAFTEDGVNFETLRQLLGDEVADGEEKYGLNWHGKKKARQIALTPSLGTLRPCKEESVDWDTTQNLFLEGDNLEVLKLLQKSYANKVKMIYIDPPYNTGKEFIYPDKFKDNLDTYLKYTGQKDDEGFKVSSNTDSSGRYHTNWLNMMYPRLKLARGLLKDDGVIFISIDDNEVASLRKICDEIFGEENFVANVVWQKKYAATNDAKGFSVMHDHIVIYQKSDSFERILLPRTEEQNKPYKNNDNDGRGLWRSDNLLVRSFSPSGVFPISNPNTGENFMPPEGSCWRGSKETIYRWLQEDRIFFGKDGLGAPQLKRYLNEVQQGRVPVTWWTFKDVGHNDGANKELKALFKTKAPFDTPKPSTLIAQMLKVSSKSDDIILDFFAGSCTTVHAVFDLNKEDGKNRKFIMVQLPEPCDEKTEAFKAGYKTIAEIGKERIRRAAAKIKEETPLYQGDLGFKVFKLDSSNIQTWNPDRDDLEQTLLEHADHLVEGRSEEDVLYELLLKRGVDLTVPIEERIITTEDKPLNTRNRPKKEKNNSVSSVSSVVGRKVFSIGYGVLFACLDTSISRNDVESLAQGIVAWHEELKPESDTQVVFRDSAFADDIAKTNMTAILEQNGIAHVRSL